MCKKIIELPVKNYRIRIDNDPVIYSVEKYSGKYINAKTQQQEEKWTMTICHDRIVKLIDPLVNIITIERLEQKHKDDEICTLTIKKYLSLLYETELEIKALIEGV